MLYDVNAQNNKQIVVEIRSIKKASFMSRGLDDSSHNIYRQWNQRLMHSKTVQNNST